MTFQVQYEKGTMIKMMNVGFMIRYLNNITIQTAFIFYSLMSFIKSTLHVLTLNEDAHFGHFSYFFIFPLILCQACCCSLISILNFGMIILHPFPFSLSQSQLFWKWKLLHRSFCMIYSVFQLKPYIFGHFYVSPVWYRLTSYTVKRIFW